jgi:hypothetical protein
MTMGGTAVDLSDPAWLAHRYDESADAIRFLRCSREERAAVPFLTDEYLGHCPLAALPRAAALGGRGTADVGFIFHSAYCCSTLLSNIFDLPGRAMALKEPQILNDMVGWRHRGADPAAVRGVLDASLGLLARPFAPGETVIVKPSNVVNGLASAMLALRPDARAILLHAPLRAFITSIARKGMWGRLWVRELLSRQLVDGMVDLGFEPRDYLLHTDLQAAAVGWLAQQKLFAALIARWPDRLRSLNSETLVANPQAATAAAAQLFAVSANAEELAVVTAAQFSRDAKSGETFGQGQRAADRAAGEAAHAEEIDKVTAWAEAVAANAGVPMTLPAPLMAK